MTKKTLRTMLLAYSEGFVSILPYVLIMATSLLLAALFDLAYFTAINTALSSFFPMAMLIALTHQVSVRYKTHQLYSISVAVAVYLSVESLSQSGASTTPEWLFTQSSFTVIMLPCVVVWSMLFATKKTNKYMNIDLEVSSSINHIYSSLLCYVVITAGLIMVSALLHWITSFVVVSSLSLSDNALNVIRNLFVHIFWFVGLHGAHFFDMIFGSEFLNRTIFDGITYKQFYDLFVINGGSGAGVSLLLSVFLVGRDKRSRRVAKLASPYVLFNINEILLFGLPILFNRLLLAPFILVPFVNMAISYLVMSFFPIQIVNTDVPWVTPIFVNAYIATDGNMAVILLQFILVLVGTLIYIPFVRSYSSKQSATWQSHKLSSNLDLSLELNSQKGLKCIKDKRDKIETNYEVEKTIELLSDDSLTVYYQPKVDISRDQCQHFEALLRIKMDDGSVRGPFFLNTLEDAGLAPIVDLWVCQKVRHDLSYFMQQGIDALISINLHPDTLANNESVDQIIKMFSGESVDFEVIERGLLNTDTAVQNIHRLKDSGFNISIDDFGTGFSSLDALCSLPVDTLKIDKSLIDLITTPEGYSVCKFIAELCTDLGFVCVAEGVETSEQYECVALLNIGYIQGYFFSPAFSIDEVQSYRLTKPVTEALTE